MYVYNCIAFDLRPEYIVCLTCLKADSLLPEFQTVVSIRLECFVWIEMVLTSLRLKKQWHAEPHTHIQRQDETDRNRLRRREAATYSWTK